MKHCRGYDSIEDELISHVHYGKYCTQDVVSKPRPHAIFPLTNSHGTSILNDNFIFNAISRLTCNTVMLWLNIVLSSFKLHSISHFIPPVTYFLNIFTVVTA